MRSELNGLITLTFISASLTSLLSSKSLLLPINMVIVSEPLLDTVSKKMTNKLNNFQQLLKVTVFITASHKPIVMQSAQGQYL